MKKDFSKLRVERLELDVIEYQKTISQLEFDLKEANKIIGFLEDINTNLEIKNNDLSKKCEDLEDEIYDLEQDISRLENEIEDLENEIEDLEDELNEQEINISETQSYHKGALIELTGYDNLHSVSLVEKIKELCKNIGPYELLKILEKY